MMKKLLMPTLLVLTVACASAPMNSSGSSGSSGSFFSRAFSSSANSYVLLSAPGQIRDLTMNPIRSLHVNGRMTNIGFSPVGDVQGNGSFCADGKDWLDLSNLTVHKASEGKTPTAPYLLGCAASDGFQPASRTIVTQ
jgi:hypothetical protein